MGHCDIITEIAKRHGVSPGEVRADMEDAIEKAFRNPDPKVRKAWKAIAPDGTPPTPENLIFRIAFALTWENECPQHSHAQDVGRGQSS